jgi:hypothetical protein
VAYEAGDVAALVALLSVVVVVTAPLAAGAYVGRVVAAGVFDVIFTRDRSHRLIPTRRNGQAAFGVYVRDQETAVLHANGVLVVTPGQRPDRGDDPLRQQRYRKVRTSPAAPLTCQA